MAPPSFCKTGSMIFVMSSHWAAAEIMTVPGAMTSSPGYFCFMESESLPVGILMPRAMAKSEQACTALYKRASSPSFLQAHIQLADNETLFRPSFRGAQTRLERDSAMALRLPAASSIRAVNGEWPIDVAIPY